jgi:hypothetical protein
MSPVWGRFRGTASPPARKPLDVRRPARNSPAAAGRECLEDSILHPAQPHTPSTAKPLAESGAQPPHVLEPNRRNRLPTRPRRRGRRSLSRYAYRGRIVRRPDHAADYQGRYLRPRIGSQSQPHIDQ